MDGSPQLVLFNLENEASESNSSVPGHWCLPCVCLCYFIMFMPLVKHNWTGIVQYSNHTYMIFQLQVKQARRNLNELIVYSIHLLMGQAGWLSKCASSKHVFFFSSIQYVYIKLHYPFCHFLNTSFKPWTLIRWS